MNSETRLSIRKFAEKLLFEIYQNEPEYPVDVVDVISKLGGQIRCDYEEPQVDAKITPHEGAFLIDIRSDLHENRRRFTLAHELGHLFLHMKFLDNEKWKDAMQYEDCAFRRTDGDYREEELQANEFAASFLMPSDTFKREAISNISSDGATINIQPIANKFGVSVEAAINRGKWLGVFEW